MSQPLTFSELPVHAWFIAFPVDGDDAGHGGYRSGSYVFKKTEPYGAAALPWNAKRETDGNWSHMPDSMQVLRVFL